MKKIYNSPMVNVVMFRANDIIATSDPTVSGDGLPGFGTPGGVAGSEDGDALAPTRGGRF